MSIIYKFCEQLSHKFTTVNVFQVARNINEIQSERYPNITNYRYSSVLMRSVIMCVKCYSVIHSVYEQDNSRSQ